MSADLVYQVTRRWNCHQIKRPALIVRRTNPKKVFTTVKGSLGGTSTFADCGASNRKAVDISANEDGTPVLSLKNDRDADMRKPDKMWATTTLTGGVRKAIAKTDKALSMYRPAARTLALRKVSALARANARVKSGVDHTKVKKGRHSRK
jgi:Ribosomal L28e protein family